MVRRVSLDRRANMRANRRRDTKPERRIRSALHSAGLRFRVDLPVRTAHPRLIRPDIVFTRARLAVFVDGCFWHGCPAHGQRPSIHNGAYWTPKIAGNAERDQVQTRALDKAGWTVLRFWEHEPPEEVAQQIAAAYQDELLKLAARSASDRAR
jgi:DNA mismatch endonuclease, patch repair protein